MEKRKVGRVRKRNRNAARKRNLSLEDLAAGSDGSEQSDAEAEHGNQELPDAIQPDDPADEEFPAAIDAVEARLGSPTPDKVTDSWCSKPNSSAGLSTGQYLALFSKICESSKISNGTRNDLLFLQSMMFPTDADFPSSLFLLKSGLEKRSLNRKFRNHRICLSCGTYAGEASAGLTICPNNQCQEDLKPEECSFSYLPIEPVLQDLLSATSLETLCPQPSRKISDFNSGSVYSAYYISANRFVPVVLFSDGASAAKSSNASMWVVQYHVPRQGEKPTPVLSTIWFRSSRLSTLRWKEPKNLKQGLLRPVINEIVRLQTTGIQYEVNGRPERAPLRILHWITDSQERWRILNLTCFSGPCGCVHCEHPGKRVSLAVGNNRTVQCYPLLPTTNLSENLVELRDMERVRILGVQADNAALDDGVNPPELKGVRGTTVLSELLHFNTVTQVPPEPMHLCFEGVEKMLTEMRKSGPIWKLTLEQKRSLDDQMLSIQPPSELTRLRSLSQSGKWKAHEFFNFTQYYSLPCFYGLMNQKDFITYAKFASACQLMFTPSLTEEDLFPLSRALLEFSRELQEAAGERYMSYNLHQLCCHLIIYIHNLGHPSSFWAFEHESFIGNLKRQLKGSTNAAKELANKMTLTESAQKLEKVYIKPTAGESVLRAQRALSGGLHVHTKTVSSQMGKTYFFGKAIPYETIRQKEPELYSFIKNVYPGASEKDLLLYDRCASEGNIRLDSVDYQRKKLRVNAVFAAKSGTFYVAKKFPVCEQIGNQRAALLAYRVIEKDWHCSGFRNDDLLKMKLFTSIYSCVSVTQELVTLSFDDIAYKAMIILDREGNELAVRLNRKDPE